MKHLLLPFLFSLLWGKAAAAADWPHYLGPNQNTLVSGQADGDELVPIWKAQVGMGCSTFSVVGNRVYTMGNNGQDVSSLFCLDARTGEVLWRGSFRSDSTKKNFGGGGTPFYGGPNSTPAVDGNRVYTVGRFGQVICWDAESGEMVWSWNWTQALPSYSLPQWGYAGSPVVSGERLFVEPGGEGNSVVCLDKKTGQVLWTAGDDEAGYATPVVARIDGRETLLSFNAFGLVGRSLEDGQEFFRYRWKTSYQVNSASPVVVNENQIFLSSGYGTGCVLLQVKGGQVTPLWRNKNLRNKHTVSVFLDGYLYGFDERSLVCLDIRNGDIVWEEKRYRGKGALSMTTENQVFLVSEKGQVALGKVTPQGFQETDSKQTFSEAHSWVMPIYSNGRLFTKDVKGNVVAFAVQ
ncbi:MAG: PQQ-binding-like beta-propeller repeat protein [Verrucomicrobiota bacterium]